MNNAPELQRRRAPEPGRPFVNRQNELRLVKSKLDMGVKGKPMPSAVLCFWGAFGMGKSWLLVKLECLYRYNNAQVHSSHPTIAARLDLNKEILPDLWQGNRLDRVQLIQELWKQLASQTGDAVPDLGQTSAEEWLDAFVNQVTAWASRSATPVIMLDTLDDLLKLDEQTFFWLEGRLVERLAMTDRVLFVFTSRGELQHWRSFLVRQRVDSRRLNAFDVETAGKEIKANPYVSRELFRHAFGHPLVTEQLGTALEENEIDLQAMTEGEQFIEPSLARAILAKVVEEILQGLSEPLEELTRRASVLRWVSVEPLRYLVKGLGLVEGDPGDAYYLDLITRLQAQHLLYWSNVGNNYEPDPVLRRLLAHALELDNSKQFCASHHTAFTFHHEHLNQRPAYLARYVPELAYHRAVLGRCESSPPLPDLRTWWKSFLAERAPSHPEPWDELLQALERDEELLDILPAKDYKLLHSETRKRTVEP